MTADQDLSARLPCGCCGAMQPLSAYANDPVVMVITYADHLAAVQAAVAKAVEASLKPLVWEEVGYSVIGTGHFDAKFIIGVRENGFHVSLNTAGATLKTLAAAKRFYEQVYRDHVLAAFDTAAIRSRGVAG